MIILTRDMVYNYYKNPLDLNLNMYTSTGPTTAPYTNTNTCINTPTHINTHTHINTDTDTDTHTDTHTNTTILL